MCRNIRTLFNFEPAATEDEIRAASLQFVRKLSGFNAPSQTNAAAFERAIDEVTAAASRLLASLETDCPAEGSRRRSGESPRARPRRGSAAFSDQRSRAHSRPNAASHSACLKPTSSPPSYSTIGRLIIDGCSIISAIAFA